MRDATSSIAVRTHYTVVPDWERLPAGLRHGDATGVAVDSQDRVFVLTRRDAHCLVYKPDGTFICAFGEDLFTELVHALTIDADDFLWVVDGGDHTVRKYAPDGELLLTLGRPGVAADTGWDGQDMNSIRRVGPPFNRPTKAAIAPNGDIYVSDGYGNARVHHFAPDGELIASWGEAGSGPGQFVLPHGLWVADDRVFVADRENNRIQVFSLAGELLQIWPHIQRPADIFVDQDGLMYVAYLPWHQGVSELGGPVQPFSLPGGVYVLDLSGNVLANWCNADYCAPGSFCAPHTITTDSRGDLYVGEVTWTHGVMNGYVPEGCHSLQKFERR